MGQAPEQQALGVPDFGQGAGQGSEVKAPGRAVLRLPDIGFTSANHAEIFLGNPAVCNLFAVVNAANKRLFTAATGSALWPRPLSAFSDSEAVQGLRVVDQKLFQSGCGRRNARQCIHQFAVVRHMGVVGMGPVQAP